MNLQRKSQNIEKIESSYYTFEGVRIEQHTAPSLWPKQLFYVNTAYISKNKAIELAREHFAQEYFLWWYAKGWWSYRLDGDLVKIHT